MKSSFDILEPKTILRQKNYYKTIIKSHAKDPQFSQPKNEEKNPRTLTGKLTWSDQVGPSSYKA